ncbi:uncharacterized protein BO87DRAFT_401276 [Aspergillus neoniger CBS 115656]|uniref:Uncharacterized protein n=1 Tax=Aspergillus neoniger (strain CBS 115656) TaxID=1448310 RepID=A0A318YMP4_ASPNB|nr:hypothetical protein BO87DRAFT_401276 [Aspergillus neoniger CBS 115656]PYH29498.1 hypothetical protein BO87DRAFT_401276 [Aspergillus neoniger CBS 115656]
MNYFPPPQTKADTGHLVRCVDVLVAGLTEDWVRKNTEIDEVVVNSCPLSVRPMFKNIANPQGPARNDRKDTRRLNGKNVERGESRAAAPARREKVKGGKETSSREKEEGG